MILALLTAALVQPASAQPQDSASVLSGEDIVAWRALPQDDPQALRGFIHDYPSSPLSERAFTRLQELGDHQPVLSVPRGLEASADAHYRVLVRPSGRVSVATMDLSAPAPSATGTLPGFSPRLELGAVTLGGASALSLGAGLQSRYLGGLTRLRLGQSTRELQLGVRLELPNSSSWTPYAEWLGAYQTLSHAYPAARSPWSTGVALGVSRDLSKNLSVQLALEYWPTGSELGLSAGLRYSF